MSYVELSIDIRAIGSFVRVKLLKFNDRRVQLQAMASNYLIFDLDNYYNYFRLFCYCYGDQDVN